jgi:hypothetical protein
MMLRKQPGLYVHKSQFVTMSLALVLGVITPLLSARAADNRTPQIQLSAEENSPSVPLEGGPLQSLPGRHASELSKASPTSPALEGALDLNFEGFRFIDNAAQNNGYIFIPPDPMGAAGMSRLVAVVNAMLECRTKGGYLKWRSGLASFYSDLAPKTNTFDPKIVYDEHANRFVVLALERVGGGGNMHPANESRLLIAVSKNDTPRSATSDDWTYAAIDAKTIYNLPAPYGTRDGWADYPGLEVGPEAVYITSNIFGFSPGYYFGVNLWILDKGLGSGGLYDGGPLSYSVHDPYAGGGSVTTTQPTQIHGAAGVGGGVGTFLVSYSGLRDGTGLEYVQVISVLDPLGSMGGPNFVQQYIPVADIDSPGSLPDAPQAGTNDLIEVNDRRALDAVWRDGTLWMTATTLPPTGPEAGETTAYWFALDTSGGAGALALADHGPIGGEDIAAGTYTFFPAVAVNALGDAMFGFSASAPSIYAGAYAAGRQVGDAAGTVQPTLTIKAGKDWYYRVFSGTRNRWGDYSGMCVDPEETDKFWVFNEFADTRGTPTSGGTQDGQWGTVWGRVKFLGEDAMQGAVVEVLEATDSRMLFQNEPNPFNPMTRIQYDLPRDMHVTLSIFNVRGQHVRTLLDRTVNAGLHEVTWNGRDASGVRVPSGAYLYRLEGEGIRETRRMIVLQ